MDDFTCGAFVRLSNDVNKLLRNLLAHYRIPEGTQEIDIDGLTLQKYVDDEQNNEDDEFVKTKNSKTRRRSKARVLRSLWFNKQRPRLH